MTTTKKTRVAFIKFGGLASGGTEKYIQNIAARLPKDKYEVTYFYTDAAPYIGSDWKHPDTDLNRKAYLEANGVKLVKVDVQAKDVRHPTHPWVGTNLFDLFSEDDFDIVQTGRAGHPEFPFTHINRTSIVDVITLPGMAENKPNVEKVIHISSFQAQTWVQAGGDAAKVAVIPIISEIEYEPSWDTFRAELGIGPDDFVCGFHQRNDPEISSPVSLQAFKQVFGSNPSEAHFVLMGGSSKHDEWAQQLGIKNFHHLPHSGDPKVLNKFLRTLDVFTHARSDGETYGLSIAEAMCYGLPVVSHLAPSNGHVETIGAGGLVADSIDAYAGEVLRLFKYPLTRGDMGETARKEYLARLAAEPNMKKIEAIYAAIVNKRKADFLPDEEFWDNIWQEEV